MDTIEGPTWLYGPNGVSAIFEAGDEIPEGWVDHPSKVEGFVAPVDGSTEPNPLGPVDSSGWEWDATRNTPNKGMTQSGLWQLLPGQSRPAPKSFDL